MARWKVTGRFGAPVRRTRRRKSQKMDFQELWDSCAQNTTSEISKSALSRIMELMCAEQDVGNLKKCTFRKSRTPVRRTKRRKSQQMYFQNIWDSRSQSKPSEISNNALSEILGLWLAERQVGNLNKYTFKISGTLVCRTTPRKSQNMHLHKLRGSNSQNKTSNNSKQTRTS